MPSDFREVGVGWGAIWVSRRVDQERLERAMDDEVGVATDGGGEVAVIGFSEAVVPDGVRCVGRAFKAFEESEFDDVFFG